MTQDGGLYGIDTIHFSKPRPSRPGCNPACRAGVIRRRGQVAALGSLTRPLHRARLYIHHVCHPGRGRHDSSCFELAIRRIALSGCQCPREWSVYHLRVATFEAANSDFQGLAGSGVSALAGSVLALLELRTTHDRGISVSGVFTRSRRREVPKPESWLPERTRGGRGQRDAGLRGSFVCVMGRSLDRVESCQAMRLYRHHDIDAMTTRLNHMLRAPGPGRRDRGR
jgi:hypothetical protein